MVASRHAAPRSSKASAIFSAFTSDAGPGTTHSTVSPDGCVLGGMTDWLLPVRRSSRTCSGKSVYFRCATLPEVILYAWWLWGFDFRPQTIVLVGRKALTNWRATAESRSASTSFDGPRMMPRFDPFG